LLHPLPKGISTVGDRRQVQGMIPGTIRRLFPAHNRHPSNLAASIELQSVGLQQTLFTSPVFKPDRERMASVGFGGQGRVRAPGTTVLASPSTA
jgi:hypothetical protein